jgi:predicted P-loop ATPase
MPYYAESGLNRDKDSMILMSEKLLINNDEFGGIMRMNEMEQFKRLASAESFDERRAYGRYNEKFRRRAVLCGTSNRFEVISDQTASNTRIIPVELKSYNHELFNSIDKTRLLAELARLYNTLGKDCVKLNADDRKALEEYSQSYETLNLEKEAILDVCKPGDEFRTSSQILSLMKDHGAIAINPKKISQQLKKIGFKPHRKLIEGRNVRGWLVKIIRFDPNF